MRIHIHFSSLNRENDAARGLSNMIKIAKKEKLIDEFLLQKADELRKFTNPFKHFKEFKYPDSLMSRVQKNGKQFYDQLEHDAKKAVGLMVQITNWEF